MSFSNPAPLWKPRSCPRHGIVFMRTLQGILSAALFLRCVYRHERRTHTTGGLSERFFLYRCGAASAQVPGEHEVIVHGRGIEIDGDPGQSGILAVSAAETCLGLAAGGRHSALRLLAAA